MSNCRPSFERDEFGFQARGGQMSSDVEPLLKLAVGHDVENAGAPTQ